MTTITITAKMVSDLRARTGAGLMDCKNALKETHGDFEEAITYLRKKGVATAAKKAGREVSEGIVESYIHLGGKVGVLVEINCETDFVAKNEDFKSFARGICLHIAAAAPLCISRDCVPEAELEKEREVARAQCAGKPDEVIEKIVEGKINKWLGQVCLLDQSYVKNSEQTVQDLLNEKISQLGENVVIHRFTRFQIGE